MLKVAVLAPAVCGDMVKVTVQAAPSASVAPHVLVWVKSAALAPVIVSGAMVRSAVLRLVIVTVLAGLVVPTLTVPKESVFALNEIAVVPDPPNFTVWGLPPALSVKLRLADRTPVDKGVNVTVTVQLAPAARFDPQVVVFGKSAGFVPVTAIDVILIAAFPVLVRVTSWVALGVK
jgi:hypothetical protein